MIGNPVAEAAAGAAPNRPIWRAAGSVCRPSALPAVVVAFTFRPRDGAATGCLYQRGPRSLRTGKSVLKGGRCATEDVGKLRHASTIARIAAAISGDSGDFAKVLPSFPARTAKQQPIPTRLRTRRWPRQYSTPSWPAAYNLACAYVALAAHPDAKPQPDPLIKKVVGSLEFAICNPECEMERPSEWIGNDPDFSQLSGGQNDCFMAFLDDSGNETIQSAVSRLGPTAGRVACLAQSDASRETALAGRRCAG